MTFYPDSSRLLEYKILHPTTKVLVDPESTSIVIIDPVGTQRVPYDASYLTKVSTGYYRYFFKIPEDVIEGDWYALIHIVINTLDCYEKVYFQVAQSE